MFRLDLGHQCIPSSMQILEHRLNVTFNPFMSITMASSRYARIRGLAATIVKGAVARWLLPHFVGLEASATHSVIVSPTSLAVVH